MPETALPEKMLIVLGMPKAGTTSLANWLAGHPDFVLGQEKEPRFFTDFDTRPWSGPGSDGFKETLITTPAAFAENFAGCRARQWAVDASTDYLWCSRSPEKIAQFAQTHEVKLVCVIRDPVARAISEYNHTLRDDWEKLSFSQSLDAEAERMADGFHPLFYHAARSTCHDAVNRYHALFGADLLILDYADLADPVATMARLCDLCGVDPGPEPDTERKNESLVPRRPGLKRALSHPAALAVARKIVPQSVRSGVWTKLHTNSRNKVTVAPAEIDRFRRQIQSEIERCVTNPLIPTDNWHQALPSL